MHRLCVRRGAAVVPRCSAGEPQKTNQAKGAKDPYAEILRIRAARRTGMSLSVGAMAASFAVAVGSGAVVPPPALPLPLPPPEAALAAAASVAAASLAAKLALGDRLHVEFDGPRLFVEVLPPSQPLDDDDSDDDDDDGEQQQRRQRRQQQQGRQQQTPPPRGRPDGRPWLVVRDVGDGRGSGVYVAAASEGGEKGKESPHPPPPLPRGAFLGSYEGDLLDERSFWRRYPRGVGDYCIGCGSGWCLDGAPVAARMKAAAAAAAAAAAKAAKAATTEEKEGKEGEDQQQQQQQPPSFYSPCLINHSSTRCNVARITRRSARRVELYASRDIFPGEEVLLDYGRRYWLGREGEEKD